MNDFWNSRYSERGFAYGMQPNEFLKQQLLKLTKGRILFPAEGEGRNAVYAAAQGFDVSAFDPSAVGREKALELAARNEVGIDYRIETYESIGYPPDSFDYVVLIFAHMPADKRREWHRKLAGFLRPGGKIIIEGFAKEQITLQSGGPPNIDMLFSAEELLDDFAMLHCESIKNTFRVLDEGAYHQGKAALVQAVFVK